MRSRNTGPVHRYDGPDLPASQFEPDYAFGCSGTDRRALARLRALYETKARRAKDLEQAVSDQQSAEGAQRAARDAVRIFGKTEAEIDQIIGERRADLSWWWRSDHRSHHRPKRSSGLFVRPGTAPAPYWVADVSTMWMLANVAEQRHFGLFTEPGGQGFDVSRIRESCSRDEFP